MSECWYFFLIFDHLFQIIQDIWHKSDNLGEIWQNLIQRLNHRQVPIELSLSMGARTNLISSWINWSSLFLVLLSPPLVVAVLTNMSYAPLVSRILGLLHFFRILLIPESCSHNTTTTRLSGLYLYFSIYYWFMYLILSYN